MLVERLNAQDPRKSTKFTEHIEFAPMDILAEEGFTPIGLYTVTDEHGRSEHSLIFEEEDGDLYLDGGESLCRVEGSKGPKSIGRRQRQLVEEFTPDLKHAQREQLIRDVWRPGMRDRELFDRVMLEHDTYLHGRGILPSAGRRFRVKLHVAGGCIITVSVQVSLGSRKHPFRLVVAN
jgi:hypothetical protein